jgi:hypothetical protein
MRAVIISIIVIILSGCSDINVKKNGGTWDVSYNSLFRDLKDLYVSVDKEEGVTVQLGSASTSDEFGDLVDGLNAGKYMVVEKRPR